MTTATKKENSQVMTLREFAQVLRELDVKLSSRGRSGWIAKCDIPDGDVVWTVEAVGASPSKAVENLLVKIGGGNG